MADRRLDGQIEFEGPWREPAPALLARRIGGKPCSVSTEANRPRARTLAGSPRAVFADTE
jgi:hypothetical protein